jgi:hypothetical protein
MLPSLSRPPLEWMQSPFTPRINQPVTDQRLQNVAPTGSFELLIENARQPTRAPLARTMQLHLIEAHLYAIRSGMVRHRPFRGKQGQLRRLLRSFIEGFDNLTPCFTLAIVISPRYSTLRCTTLPPAHRLLSTIFQ